MVRLGLKFAWLPGGPEKQLGWIFFFFFPGRLILGHNFLPSHKTDQYLAFLHEHLNWLILITAHVLADSGAGEKPLVPDALMRLSVLQVGEGVLNKRAY